jgi:hypothetical protein
MLSLLDKNLFDTQKPDRMLEDGRRFGWWTSITAT